VTNADYLHLLQLAAPEVILTIAALAALLIDLGLLREQVNSERRVICAMVAAVGCIAAFMFMVAVPQNDSLLDGMLVINPLTIFTKQCLLLLTLGTVLLSIQTEFTDHVGEFFAVLLLGTVGMMFLISAEELLAVFLALEMTSLSLYLLTGFNKHDPRSAEAALKYFLFGGVAAAATLFGFSLLYGLAGSTNLHEIATAIAGKSNDPMTHVAIAMILAGFGFKVAAVPFHLWAPDAYQGAPAPSAALIASGSKLASFFVLAKLLIVGLAPAAGSAAWRAQSPGWLPVVGAIAAASMIFGNLAAIAQSDVRRLLGYSAVAHAGYTLVGLMGAGAQALPSTIYYVATYGAAVIGAFSVAGIVVQDAGSARLENFAGLAKRSPALAVCLMIFILSLAGIPPLAGFFGKFYLFVSAASPKLGLLWLVILAIAMSAVSLYYYLIVLKQVFVVETESTQPAVKLAINPGTLAGVILLAAAVILAGCAPDLLLNHLGAILTQ
jgi:NADH-quinone oxidoreductase subunit N